MADWSLSSDPHQTKIALAFGKSERLHSANWAMDWLKVYSKNQDMYS